MPTKLSSKPQGKCSSTKCSPTSSYPDSHARDCSPDGLLETQCGELSIIFKPGELVSRARAIQSKPQYCIPRRVVKHRLDQCSTPLSRVCIQETTDLQGSVCTRSKARGVGSHLWLSTHQRSLHLHRLSAIPILL